MVEKILIKSTFLYYEDGNRSVSKVISHLSSIIVDVTYRMEVSFGFIFPIVISVFVVPITFIFKMCFKAVITWFVDWWLSLSATSAREVNLDDLFCDVSDIEDGDDPLVVETSVATSK